MQHTRYSRDRIFANLQNASNMELANVLYVSSRFLEYRIANMRDVFSNVELANMPDVFFRIYAGCSGMWNSEYGYVFAKSTRCFFRMWNCESSIDVRMRNWQDIPNIV